MAVNLELLRQPSKTTQVVKQKMGVSPNYVPPKVQKTGFLSKLKSYAQTAFSKFKDWGQNVAKPILKEQYSFKGLGQTLDPLKYAKTAFKTFAYEPEEKKLFPSSPFWDVKEISKLPLASKERREKEIKLASSLALALSSAPKEISRPLSIPEARNILKVGKNASTGEIESAYKNLIKKEAPRSLQDIASRYKTNAARIINEARQVLTKPVVPAQPLSLPGQLSQVEGGRGEITNLGPSQKNLQGQIPQAGVSMGKIGPSTLEMQTPKLSKQLSLAGKLSPNIPGQKIPLESPLKTSEGIIPQAEEPLQKVITALKEAKPIRGRQEALYTKIRGQRLAKALEVGKQVTGEKGFYAELGQFKGKMPKVEYESIRGKIGQEDIDDLFVKVKDSPLLNEWDKLATRVGLAKVFGEYGGEVPTKGELKLLNKVFGPEFVKAAGDKMGNLAKLKQAGYEVLNVPRALMASFDLSAPFRQGAFLVGKPKQFVPAFVKMFKYFGSEKAFTELQQEIISRPTYELMLENGLALTDLDSALTNREEAFMSSLAEKIPLVGIGVKASERAYVGFLNKLRADVFDDLIKKAEKIGLEPKKNPVLLTDLADFINTATGRGTFRGAFKPLNEITTALNSFLFSPKLMASRLNLLNPKYYVKLEPFTRKEALKSLFSFATIGLTILGLAKMAGAEVGTDPKSSDFGKIKIGNTRFDIWGGFQQYIVLATRLITGKTVSSTTGEEYTMGEGYKPLTRAEILGRAVEYKQAPIASFATELLRGRTLFGETPDWGEEIANRFIPMVIQDMSELYKDRDDVLMGIPTIFGVGMQTYKSDVLAPKNYLKLKSDQRRRQAINYEIRAVQKRIREGEITYKKGKKQIDKLRKKLQEIGKPEGKSLIQKLIPK